MVHLQPPALPAAYAVVVAVVAIALTQLVLGRWRDLGPATAAACGIAAILAPAWPTWAAVGGAAAIAAVAWARGGAVGVGQPALAAVTLAAAVAVNAGVAAWAGWDPRGLPPAARAGGAAVIGAVGLVALTVALRRPGARHPRVRWIGELRVPVSGAAAE